MTARPLTREEIAAEVTRLLGMLAWEGSEEGLDNALDKTPVALSVTSRRMILGLLYDLEEQGRDPVAVMRSVLSIWAISSDEPLRSRIQALVRLT